MKKTAERLSIISLLIASLGMCTLFLGGLRHIGMLIYKYIQGLPLVVEPVYSLVFWGFAIILVAIIVFGLSLTIWSKIDTKKAKKTSMKSPAG